MNTTFFPTLATAALLLLVSCEQQANSRGMGSRAEAAASGWSVALLPQRWSMRGFQEDKDLSGMAAWDAAHCLVCSDELRFIQTGSLDRNRGTITAGASIPLLPGDSGKNEVDAEGVAAARSEGCYYVTGSHGVGKKRGDFQPSRCNVIRIPVNPATGEAQSGGVQTASLLSWVQKDPVLGSSVGRSLQQNGFNIEGLTWKDERLWFGVRAPNVNGDAFIIEASGPSIFSGRPQATLHRLTVGPGLGIREIAALREGFLIVTGEAASDVGKDDSFAFFRWKPGGAAAFIGELPSPSGKAEGLFILDEGPGHIDVLVIFDGAPAGGPKAYRLTKS